MDIQKLAERAVEAINLYKKDTAIMEFATKEAIEKTAKDISSTKEQVELMSKFDKRISAIVESYINAGLFGCYLASLTK